MTFRMNIIGLALFSTTLMISGCGNAMESQKPLQTLNENQNDRNDKDSNKNATPDEDEYLEHFEENLVFPLACKAATRAQISVVNQGNAKKESFLQKCARDTGGSAWCAQLIRPNPSSVSIFRCTYGATQVHQLINPNETSWKHAIGAVKLIVDLEQKGLRVCQIYNWWRPEPYNKNVGGAAGRHPLATSVDVRFCSNADANRAFDELCKYRKQGRIRAIGHYGTSALHFGVGDSTANTWGRTCPK